MKSENLQREASHYKSILTANAVYKKVMAEGHKEFTERAKKALGV